MEHAETAEQAPRQTTETAPKATGLRAKVAAIVSLCLISTVLVVAGVNFATIWRLADQVTTQNAETRSTLLAENMSGAIVFDTTGRGLHAFESFPRESSNLLTSAHVFDASGAPLAVHGDKSVTTPAGLTDGLSSSTPVKSELIGTTQYVATLVTSAQSGMPVGTIIFSWDRSAMNKSIWSSQLLAMGLAVIAGLAGLAMTLWRVSAVAIKPLSGLTQAMDRIANREFDADVPFTDRLDEIGMVGRNLLEFRDRLSQEAMARAARRNEEESKSAFFNELSGALSDVAGGDLSKRLDADTFTDLDVGSQQVCKDFNDLITGFSDAISTIVSTAESVRTSSAEISEVANTQSMRSEAQASTLEESAAALDGLTKSVKSAAEHAAEADLAVSENRRQAENSGDVVRRAVSAMQQIEQSSSQITQIISVIDDIAFQTNLLALNAGVEAARAGESGRGFAVVASEVRALAQRASDSAREIKDLISTSGQQVNEGGALVSQTGDALAEIIGRFGKVSDLVSNIAISLREQSTGLEEINSGINQLDKVTQQNAAVIEETSASSQALSAEAERLSLVLQRFKLGANAAGAAPVLQQAVGDTLAPPSAPEATTSFSMTSDVETEVKNWDDALNEPDTRASDEDWEDF